MSFGSEFAQGFAQGFQMMGQRQDKKADREFREKTQAWRERTTKENQDIERERYGLKTDADKEFERKRLAGTGAIPDRASTDTPGAAPGGSYDHERARRAISVIESGKPDGDYSVLNRHTGAIGRYQVMPANVSSWTKKWLGREMTPAEFRASPEAQDKVFDGEFGSYVKKYGPTGAANMWFSGSPNPSNKKDAEGTTVAGYGSKFNRIYAGLPSSAGTKIATAVTAPPAATPTAAAPAAPAARDPAIAPGDNGQGDLDAIINNPLSTPEMIEYAKRKKAEQFGATTAASTSGFQPDPIAGSDDDDEEAAMARGGAIPPRRKFAPGGPVNYFDAGVAGTPFTSLTPPAAPGTTGASGGFTPRKIGQAPQEYGPQPGAAPSLAPTLQPKKPKVTGTPLMQGPGKGPFSWSAGSRFEEKIPTVQGWGANSLKNLTDDQLQEYAHRSATTVNDPRGMRASGFGPASWAFGVGTQMTPEQSKQMQDYARYRIGEMGMNNAYSQADQERAESAMEQRAQREGGWGGGGGRDNRAAGGPIDPGMGKPAIPARRRRKYASGGDVKKEKKVDRNTGLPAADYDIDDYEAPTLQPNMAKGGKAYGGPYSIPRQEDIGWGVDMVTPAQARSRERRAELAAFRADMPEDDPTTVGGQTLPPSMAMMGMGGAGMGGGMGMQPGMNGMYGMTGMGQPAPGAGTAHGYRMFAEGGPADPVYGTSTGVMPQEPGQTAAQGWTPRHIGETPQEYGPQAPPPPPFVPAKPKMAPAVEKVAAPAGPDFTWTGPGGQSGSGNYGPNDPSVLGRQANARRAGMAAGGPVDDVRYGTTTGVTRGKPDEPGRPWTPNRVGDVPQEYGPQAPPPPPFVPAKPKKAATAAPEQWDLGAPQQMPGGGWSNDPAVVGGHGIPAGGAPGSISVADLKKKGWSGRTQNGTQVFEEGGGVDRKVRVPGLIEDPDEPGTYTDIFEQPRRSIRRKYTQPLGRGKVAEFDEGGSVGGGFGSKLGKKFDWHNYQDQPPEFYRAGPGGSEAQHGEVEQLNARQRSRKAPGGSDTSAPAPTTPTQSPQYAPTAPTGADPGLKRPYDSPARTKDDDVSPPVPAKAKKSKGRLKEEGEGEGDGGSVRDVETTGSTRSIESASGPSRGFELMRAGDDDLGGLDMVDEDYTRPMLMKATGLRRGGAIPSRYEDGGRVDDEASEANAARQRISQRQAARAGLTQGDLNRARSDPSRYGPYFGDDEAKPAPRGKPKAAPTAVPKAGPKSTPGPGKPVPPGPTPPQPTPPAPTPPDPTGEPGTPWRRPPERGTPVGPDIYKPSIPNELGDQTGATDPVHYEPYGGGAPAAPAIPPNPDRPMTPQMTRRATQYDAGMMTPPRDPGEPTIPSTQPRVPSTGFPQAPGETNTLPRPGISSPQPAPPYPRPLDPQRGDRTPAPPPQRHVRQIDPRTQPAMGWVYVMGPDGQPTQVPKNAAHLYPPLPPPSDDDPLPARPATPHAGVLGGRPRVAPVLAPQPFPERRPMRPPVPSAAKGGMIPRAMATGGPLMLEDPPTEESAIPPRGAPPFSQPAPAAQPVAGSGQQQAQASQPEPPPKPKLPPDQQDAIVNPNREPNPAGASVKMGLDLANDRVRQIIDGTPGSGIPGQGGGAQVQEVMQRINAGERVGDIETMTPTEVKQVYAAVDPNDELDPGMKHIKAYQDIRDYYLAQGNPLQAARTSMALTLYSKKYVQNAASMALAAINHGDTETAMKWMDKAYDKIPNNQDLRYEIGPDGQIKFQVANRATGEISKQEVLTPDMLRSYAQQFQTGTGFDSEMASAIREVGAWTGHPGAQGGAKQPNEAALKRADNAAVNAAISRGIIAGKQGDMKALTDAQQEIFERMGQSPNAVAAVTRMYEDAGIEPPASIKAYGPKRTGEEGGGTMTERDRKAREIKTKEFRTRISEAEKANDGGKAAGEAHVDYSDFVYQNQKEDQSIDKNEVSIGMPTDIKEGSPEYNSIQAGAYQLLRKNPIHAAKAVEFMKAAIAPGADWRYTEDGRVQMKGLATPLFVSRDLMRELAKWRESNKGTS